MSAAAGRVLRGLLALGFALALWQGAVVVSGVPPFILPGPLRVGESLWSNAAILAEHARFTAANLLTGLAAGVALGVATALNLALSPAARMLLRPILVFAQAVPVFALAPIITLWLGYGAPSKIVMVMLVIYFPVTSTFFDGLMRLPQPHDDMARLMRTTPLRRLMWLQVPHALPALASGLRLALVYAPFAVVIGEWVGSSRGLGYLMLMANGRGQTDLMFAALIVLAALSLALFVVFDTVLRRNGAGTGRGVPAVSGGS
ncbi:putative hydroxymethylpyrimidine transport system permease protein [Salinihabitans flavidus]|uniref:Putative hydroxymethylpyrimidine transport system permease protein n=1 Tax=Salinihabitans flavidus TaxID=569882 RepID=A0A1H8NJX5_9RHOB|nr:ABC transporter permease [Salinihabitans flavidus]SEO29914.1 putative hydroxymethylpyrimidine transport system permease protein [Salinihabitans flavidus]